MNKNSFLLIVFLSVFACYTSAQVEEKNELTQADKIFFGGNFSLQFGTPTFIEISPVAGYQIIPRVSAGLGFIYQYYRERTFFNSIFKTNIYGGRVFGQFTAIKDLDEIIPLGLHAGIIGYAEYEFLNQDVVMGIDSVTNNIVTERRWFENFYAGGGLELPMSEKVKLNLLVLWNLNETQSLNYQNPSVRIGFVIFPFRKQ